MEVQPIRVRADELEAFVNRLLLAAGVDERDAAHTAEHLVLAQMRGHHSHGLMRIPVYLQRLAAGQVAPRTDVRVVSEGPAMAVLDGGKGWGPTLGKHAMNLAISKARELAVGVVAVRNGTHAGMIGYYSEMAARAGLVGFCMVTTPRGLGRTAPHGGREPRLGTNPISFAVPAGKRPPILLDMATAAAAQGKIKLAAKAGKPIPAGWALDEHGQPTTDPTAALSGIYLPMGGHKGFGLSLVVELLCGLLSGEEAYPGKSGFASVYGAINLGLFQPLEQSRAKTDAMAELIKSTPRLEGVDEILLPGEPEFRSEAEARANGVPVAASVWDEVALEAERLRVPGPVVR